MDIKTIGIYVGIWLFGYALGLFEVWAKKKLKKEDEVPPSLPGPQDMPPAPAMPESALVIFEKNAGGLKLKIDEEMVLERADLQPEQRKRLINLVIGLRPWLDTTQKEEAGAPPAVHPASQPLPPKPAPVSSPAVSIPASTDIPTGEAEYAKLSMVEQIDRVLQKNLEGHPLKAKGIRVQESISGGVNFYIGLSRYEFIDEIPDQVVREFIQQAISEWENTATPGL